MFAFLERLMRRQKEAPYEPIEEHSSMMDVRGRTDEVPRTQTSQNRPHPCFIRQPSATNITRVFCCLRHHGSEDSLRIDSARVRSPPEFHRMQEDRAYPYPQNRSRRLDFPLTPPTPPSRTEHSRISFHKEEMASERIPAVLLYSADSGSSSSQSSDAEFFDAREFLAPSEFDNEAPMNSRFSRKASILRRCNCMTCTSVTRELGSPINYRIADVCNAVERGRIKVRMDFDVRVAKYDIRSGVVMDEWIEGLNLSEEVIPIGYLKHPDTVEDIDTRRSRARSKLRSIFGADKRVRSEEEEFDDSSDDDSIGIEDTDGLAPLDWFENIGGSEPRTSRNPGVR